MKFLTRHAPVVRVLVFHVVGLVLVVSASTLMERFGLYWWAGSAFNLYFSFRMGELVYWLVHGETKEPWVADLLRERRASLKSRVREWRWKRS